MLIERDRSNSLIVAATNHPQSLDHALFRRFHDVIEYELPEKKQLRLFLENRLSTLQNSKLDFEKIASNAEGLSYADMASVCDEVIKDMIIEEKSFVDTEGVLLTISEKKAFREKKI